VSLTSYPPRYPSLIHTIKSVLDQQVQADTTILWVAESDYRTLPRAVLGMQRHGLEIATCEDLRSFKKVLPLLKRAPSSFIVTADDDVYYDSRWLELLVEEFNPETPAILCRRAHRVRQDAEGRMSPYSEWDKGIIMSRESSGRQDVFPTGVGGVLYFPGSLSALATDHETGLHLCPYSDDVWLYWMGRMAGSLYRQVGGAFTELSWPYAHRTGLFNRNIEGGENDAAIRAMEARFGVLHNASFSY
jgi:hypothetical protein